jgi:hypothetical protein
MWGQVGTLFQHKMSLKGQACWSLNICVHKAEKMGLEAIGRFVEAVGKIQFQGSNLLRVCGGAERVLVQDEYGRLGKAAWDFGEAWARVTFGHSLGTVGSGCESGLIVSDWFYGAGRGGEPPRPCDRRILSPPSRFSKLQK